jgi:hypothetical protein
MSPVQKPQSKKSGGKIKGSVSKPTAKGGASIPLTQPPAEFGAGQGGKTLVVRDEKGQIVSVTHVSRDTRYGVGIKPGPGQVVKEFETSEDLRDALKPPQR